MSRLLASPAIVIAVATPARAHSGVLVFTGNEQRPVGVTAETVRVADLEKPERIAELHNAIRRPEGGEDAYFFLILTSGDLTHYYPFRMRVGPRSFASRGA